MIHLSENKELPRGFYGGKTKEFLFTYLLYKIEQVAYPSRPKLRINVVYSLGGCHTSIVSELGYLDRYRPSPQAAWCRNVGPLIRLPGLPRSLTNNPMISSNRRPNLTYRKKSINSELFIYKKDHTKYLNTLTNCTRSFSRVTPLTPHVWHLKLFEGLTTQKMIWQYLGWSSNFRTIMVSLC